MAARDLEEGLDWEGEERDEASWGVRVAIIGPPSEAAELVREALDALRVETELVDEIPGADLVVAVVDPADLTILTVARALATGIPLVALLPWRDLALAERAMGCGANAFYALDTPRQRLRAVLLSVLGEHLANRRLRG